MCFVKKIVVARLCIIYLFPLVACMSCFPGFVFLESLEGWGYHLRGYIFNEVDHTLCWESRLK